MTPPPDFKFLWQQYRMVVIALLLLAIVYFLLRLPRLTVLPIFADEAIYIRWSQVMKSEATLRFLPLTDGKQPLYMWLVIPALKLFTDPLIAGRIVSVAAGFGSLVGIYVLAQLITKSQRLGLTAALLYTVVPYTYFFDRMALADSLLNMFGIWAVYFSLILAQQPRLDYSFLSGAALGGAWLTKSPAIFFIGLMPVGLVTNISQLFAASKHSKHQLTGLTPTKWYLMKLVFYWLVAASLSFVIYNLLRLGPEFHQIGLRNRDYVFPLNEIISHPLNPFIQNIVSAFSFFWVLITPILFVMFLSGIIVMFKTRKSIVIFLLIWFLLPLLSQSIFARSVTARYFLFITPPVLILSAIGLQWVLNWSTKYWWKAFVAGISFVPALIFIYHLMVKPEAAPLPRIERSGYLEEWTAGTGLRKVAAYLKEQSKYSTLVVGTEGYFGTMPDGLKIYFDKDTRVTIIGQTHRLSSVNPDLYNSLTNNKVFLLANDTRFEIKDPRAYGLELVASYPKAVRPDGSQEHLLLFQLNYKPVTNIQNN